jgi:hypothetical protein
MSPLPVKSSLFLPSPSIRYGSTYRIGRERKERLAQSRGTETDRLKASRCQPGRSTRHAFPVCNRDQFGRPVSVILTCTLITNLSIAAIIHRSLLNTGPGIDQLTSIWAFVYNFRAKVDQDTFFSVSIFVGTLTLHPNRGV